MLDIMLTYPIPLAMVVVATTLFIWERFPQHQAKPLPIRRCMRSAIQANHLEIVPRWKRSP